MTSPTRRPTMSDVAKKVGISRQLVSIVLRDVEGASDETRRRVREAAAEIGYVPDEAAQMLRRRRSRQIGVLYAMRQPFDVDLVEALGMEADAAGYSIVLSTIGPGRSQAAALAELVRQRIEALVLITADDPSGMVTGIPDGMPVITLGGPAADRAHDDIRVDNAHGMELAVAHLVGLGHRSIAYIGPSSGPNGAERRDAFIAAMTGRDLIADTLPGEYTEEAGAAGAAALLRRETLPTAVICGNDRCAIGALVTFARSGVEVPRDVSVIGVDDSSAAAMPHLDMTSVRTPARQMARTAVATIARHLEDPNSALVDEVVVPDLVVRGSSGPARS